MSILNIGLKNFTKILWKFFLQKTDKRISYQDLEKTNIRWLSAKVANKLFDRSIKGTVRIDCTVYVILVLLGSVETKLW